jgi:Tol biopolymer transport system component
MKTYIQISIMLLVLLSGSSLTHAQDENVSYYTYLISDTNQYIIHQISGTSTNNFTYSGIAPLNLTPSPDGNWIAGISQPSDWNTPYNSTVQLINTNTGGLESLDQYAMSFHGFEIGFEGNRELLRWSPDSQYLTLHASTSENTDQNVILLSVADKRISIPDAKEGIASYATWSPDSERVVVGVDRCQDYQLNFNCSHRLMIWNVLRGAYENSLDLSSYFIGRGVSSCDYTWSPDGRLVAFRTRCLFGYTQDPEKEVYVWDIEEGSYRQITNLTSEIRNYAGAGISANYSLYWTDNDTIWVGANYFFLVEEASEPKNITVGYDVSTQQQNTISAMGIQELAVNPITNDLAIRATLNTTENPYDPGTILYFPNVSRQLANYALQSDTAVGISAPSQGCRLSWSADGNWLGYVISRDEIFCSYGFESIILVNIATGTVETIRLPRDKQDGIQPIGWLPPIG